MLQTKAPEWDIWNLVALELNISGLQYPLSACCHWSNNQQMHPCKQVWENLKQNYNTKVDREQLYSTFLQDKLEWINSKLHLLPSINSDLL